MCMTLYFSDHFSLLVELAMPWPLGNMTALAGQPVTTVSSGVQQPYQPSQPVNIYFLSTKLAVLSPKKQDFWPKIIIPLRRPKVVILKWLIPLADSAELAIF